MNTDKSFLNQRLSAFIGGEPFSPTLVPGGQIPWLALMMGDNLFKVGAELFIQRDRRVPLPGFPEDFRDWPAAMVRRPDHGYGAIGPARRSPRRLLGLWPGRHERRGRPAVRSGRAKTRTGGESSGLY